MNIFLANIWQLSENYSACMGQPIYVTTVYISSANRSMSIYQYVMCAKNLDK